jgi:hypothetical protein
VGCARLLQGDRDDVGWDESSTSAEITIDSTIAWLIHPNVPSLSMPLDQQNATLMGVVSLGDAVHGSTSTVHQIIAANLPVVTWVGPRLAPVLTMQVATVDVDEENALRTIVTDQTPLLFRFPRLVGPQLGRRLLPRRGCDRRAGDPVRGRPAPHLHPPPDPRRGAGRAAGPHLGLPVARGSVPRLPVDGCRVRGLPVAVGDVRLP